MLNIRSTHALAISRMLLGIFLLTTALNRFTDADTSYFITQLSVIAFPEWPWLSALLGILQLTVVAALIFPTQRFSSHVLYIYALLALTPMLMLLTHPVWIDSLGGFPAIGAGQGLIKYLAIAGVSAYIASHYAGHLRLKQWSLHIVWLGIILVMLWIGGMKFTQIEANGIERLMSTSPFFSWIYAVFSVLHGSYFIGVVELLAVFGLILGLKYNGANTFGLFIGGSTFLATQTFIISVPAYELSHGFPLLTSSGQFIIKDLVLFAGCILIYSTRNQQNNKA